MINEMNFFQRNAARKQREHMAAEREQKKAKLMAGRQRLTTELGWSPYEDEETNEVMATNKPEPSVQQNRPGLFSKIKGYFNKPQKDNYAKMFEMLSSPRRRMLIESIKSWSPSDEFEVDGADSDTARVDRTPDNYDMYAFKHGKLTTGPDIRNYAPEPREELPDVNRAIPYNKERADALEKNRARIQNDPEFRKWERKKRRMSNKKSQ